MEHGHNKVQLHKYELRDKPPSVTPNGCPGHEEPKLTATCPGPSTRSCAGKIDFEEFDSAEAPCPGEHEEVELPEMYGMVTQPTHRHKRGHQRHHHHSRSLYRRVFGYVKSAWTGVRFALDSELEELGETPARYRPDSLQALSKATKFTEAEIKRIYRNFKAECPSGMVREDTFKGIYSQFFPQGANVSQYAHYVFKTMDHTQTGLLSFEVSDQLVWDVTPCNILFFRERVVIRNSTLIGRKTEEEEKKEEEKKKKKWKKKRSRRKRRRRRRRGGRGEEEEEEVEEEEEEEEKKKWKKKKKKKEEDEEEDTKEEEINFETGLSVLSRGSVEEKLRWTFTLYDINGDGRITREEMTNIVTAIYELMGKFAETVLEDGSVTNRVDSVFKKMDKNQDGVVTLDEFLECCLNDEDIKRSIQVFDT
ncbi:hypothetical protein M8J76_010332 [Diaphorina citri]|nr:hypothetical protein M8J76_010332 [Diaphorina citri]